MSKKIFFTHNGKNAKKPKYIINTKNKNPNKKILLEKYAELKDTEQLNKLGIMCCMECGTCVFNCPAGRPLVQAIRMGKAMIRKAGKK